jgi:hypothetical protein
MWGGWGRGRMKKKGKNEKEIPYYIGGFDINFIIS